jgi:hypothetical protein
MIIKLHYLITFIILTLLLNTCSCSITQHAKDGNKSVAPKDSIILNYDSVVTELKAALSDEFSIFTIDYFVVAGNLSEADMLRIIDNTIKKAFICFYNNYFEKKPDAVTTIFLFKNDSSYRIWAKKLFEDTGLSRFGYYKPSRRVMLMNISTGTGTLVHEMTHSLVRFDFPDIPSWFNEGLGSLYERCSIENGEIKGYVNWRLPALKKAIKNNTLQSLEKLMKTDEDEFYGDNSDINYAQARYLCMYLQEKGLLKKYYKEFRDTYHIDQTGITQIEKITETKLNVLEEDYIGWVRGLSYDN